MQLSDRIGRRLKLHDLHVLMAVVQAGSMSKAAVLLNTGQSAISRSIAELERAVGVPLLERNPRGVEPTEYGRALLNGGTAVFDDLRQAVKHIEALADPAAGDVRLGSVPPLAASFVAAVINRLFQRYPRITSQLVTAQVESLCRILHERNVDFLIAPRLVPFVGGELGFDLLFEDDYVVVAGAQNPWARRRKIELAELANESWVLPPPERAIGSPRYGGSSCQRPRLSSRNCVCRACRSAHRPSGDRPLAYDFSGLRAEVSHEAFGRQYLTCRTTDCTCAERHCHPEESKAQLSPVAQLFIEHAREVAKPLVKKK